MLPKHEIDRRMLRYKHSTSEAEQTALRAWLHIEDENHKPLMTVGDDATNNLAEYFDVELPNHKNAKDAIIKEATRANSAMEE